MEFFASVFKDYKFNDLVIYGKQHTRAGSFSTQHFEDSFKNIIEPRIVSSDESTYDDIVNLQFLDITLSKGDYTKSPVVVAIKLLILIRTEYINYDRWTISKMFRSKVFDINPSISYLDWRIRLYKGGKTEDLECYNIVHAMTMLKEYKVPDESKCTFTSSDNEDFDPNLDAFYYARKTTPFEIFKVPQNLKTFKWLLRHGYPIYAGIVIMSSSINKSNYFFGDYVTPVLTDDSVFGAQPVVITGYNLKTNVFYLMSTVSNVWGDYGCGTIPIEYVLNPGIAGDFWTLTYDGYYN